MNTAAENVIYAADLFCGAGGATQALMEAAAELGARVEMVAVNHSKTAIATHEANFPGVVHYISDVEKVDPLEAVPGGYLDLLLAGPECTHFSRAAGDRPKNKQSRANATDIIWWLESLYVRNVLIENVPEFETWGPLDGENQVDKGWKGAYFRIFIDTLRELGYSVQWKKCVAADYGDPTSRERLFIQATRGGDPVWPVPTHRDPKVVHRFPAAKPWNPASGIIDLSLPSVSIYEREAHGLKELVPNTIRRIFTGVVKYWPGGFIVPNFGERDGQEPRTHDLGRPLPAVTSHGAGAYIEPMLVVARGTEGSHVAKSAKPASGAAVPTLCTGNHLYLMQPYFLPVEGLNRHWQSNEARGLGLPLPTLTQRGGGYVVEPVMQSVVEPIVVGCGGCEGNGKPRAASTPLKAVLTHDRKGVLQTFLLGQQEDAALRPAERPAPTVATAGAIAKIDTAFEPDAILIRYNGCRKGRRWEGDRRHQTLREPIGTLDTGNRYALCQFTIKYNSTGDNVAELTAPLASVTTRDRFALVSLDLVEADFGGTPGSHLYEGHIVGWLDIRYRMLTIPELAGAHSFPRGYRFVGTATEQKAQIGNSWPVKMGRALILAALTREGGAPRPLPAHVAAVAGSVHRRRVPKSRSLWAGARRRMEEPAERLAPTLFDALEEVA